MKIDPADVNAAKSVLWPNERIQGTVKQRRIGPGGSVTVPTSVILTDMRIIIINRATLGLRNDYEVIPYNAISTVRLEHGLISSSVFIRVQGYDNDKGLLKNGREEGEIDGLHNDDAQDLANFVNMKIEQRMAAEQQMEESYVDNKVGAFTFCPKCGAKNQASAAYCVSCGAKLASGKS